MTYFLRHAADKAGLNVDGEGWVKVEELVSLGESKRETGNGRKALGELERGRG